MPIDKIERSVKNLGFHLLAVPNSILSLSQELGVLGLSTKFVPSSSFRVTPLHKSKRENEFISSWTDSISRLIRTYGIACFFGPSTYQPKKLHLPNLSFNPLADPTKLTSDFSRPPNSYLRDLALHPERIPIFIKESLDTCFKMPTRFSGNVSSSSLSFIRSLVRSANVIIKPADKNLGLTVIGKDWYFNEAHRQLTDNSTYQRVTSFPLNDILFQLQSILRTHRCNNSVSKYCHSFSSNDPGKFYLLPKLHKTPTVGRPIVSSCGYVTAPTSRLLSFLFESMIPPIVLKDTNSLMRSLLLWDPAIALSQVEKFSSLLGDDTNSQHFWLFSADVEALYPNMTSDHATLMSSKIIMQNSFTVDGIELSASLVNSLFRWVLDCNFLQFDGTFFKQIKGTAMGTSMAPHYANIVVGSILLKSLNRPFAPENLSKFGLPFFLCSYIDDIFGITYGSKSQIESRIKFLRDALGINLSHNIGTSVEFLDVSVSIDPKTGILKWSTHQKVLNAYLYLPPSSNHPRHQCLSYITGELLRYSRRSSSADSYITTAKALYARLEARGFPSMILRRLFFGTSSFDTPTYWSIAHDTPLRDYWIKGQQDCQMFTPGGFRISGFTTFQPFANIPVSLNISSPLRLFLQFQHRGLIAAEQLICRKLSAFTNSPVAVVHLIRPSLGKLLIRAKSSGEEMPVEGDNPNPNPSLIKN